MVRVRRTIFPPHPLPDSQKGEEIPVGNVIELIIVSKVIIIHHSFLLQECLEVAIQKIKIKIIFIIMALTLYTHKHVLTS